MSPRGTKLLAVERPGVSDDGGTGGGDGDPDSVDGDDRVDPEDTERLDAAAREWAEPDPDDHEGILRPEDLDISSREGVETTDDGQFVISTDGEAIDPDVPAVRVVDEVGDGHHADADRENPLSAAESDLAALSTAHAFSVVARHGDETGSIQTAADDRAAALTAVLRWYADRVDPDAPPGETLRRVLAETDLDLGVDDPDEAPTSGADT